MLSAGIPMILMGDEVRRTQYGKTMPTARIMNSAGSIGDWLKAYRCPPVRYAAQRAAPFAEYDDRTPAHKPQPASSRGQLDMAWSQSWPARVGHIFAQYRAHRGNARREIKDSPDRERLLGSSRVRAAAGRPSRKRMATLDQHCARRAAGHRSLGSCSTGIFIRRTGGTPVGDRPLRRDLRKPRRVRTRRGAAGRVSRVREELPGATGTPAYPCKPICAFSLLDGCRHEL